MGHFGLSGASNGGRSRPYEFKIRLYTLGLDHWICKVGKVCEKGVKLMEVCPPFYSGWLSTVAHLMLIFKDLILIPGHLQFWTNYEFHHLVIYAVALGHKTGSFDGCCTIWISTNDPSFCTA